MVRASGCQPVRRLGRSQVAAGFSSTPGRFACSYRGYFSSGYGLHRKSTGRDKALTLALHTQRRCALTQAIGPNSLSHDATHRLKLRPPNSPPTHPEEHRPREASELAIALAHPCAQIASPHQVCFESRSSALFESLQTLSRRADVPDLVLTIGLHGMALETIPRNLEIVRDRQRRHFPTARVEEQSPSRGRFGSSLPNLRLHRSRIARVVPTHHLVTLGSPRVHFIAP